MISQTTQPITEGWTPQNVIALVAGLTALIGAAANWSKIQQEKYRRENLETKHDNNVRDIRENKEQVSRLRTDLTAVALKTPTAPAVLPVIPADIHEVMKPGSKE